MKSHLPNRVLERILDVLSQEKTVQKAFLFGSRARGDHRVNSDIDLAIEGAGIPLRVNIRLREAAGLYQLDIVHLEDIDNLELLSDIQLEGELIYEQANI